MTNDEINQCAVLVAAAMEQNLIDNGWRRCAVGQRSTQFCSQLEAAVEAARAEEREKVAHWMMAAGYATGHGDTTEDLLRELAWQADERIAGAGAAEREACADICDHLMDTAVTKEMAIAYGNAADAIRGQQ